MLYTDVAGDSQLCKTSDAGGAPSNYRPHRQWNTCQHSVHLHHDFGTTYTLEARLLLQAAVVSLPSRSVLNGQYVDVPAAHEWSLTPVNYVFVIRRQASLMRRIASPLQIVVTGRCQAAGPFKMYSLPRPPCGTCAARSSNG